MNAGYDLPVVVSGGPGSGGRVLDFRRGSRDTRRKKKSVWLSLARPLTTALALVALPGGLAAWVLTSSRFALRELAVEGARRVPEAQVRRSLAGFQGQNLVRLPLAKVEEQLRQEPWIGSLEIEKVLPDRLRVTVHERQAVALLAGPAGALSWTDGKGFPIAPVAAGEDTAGFVIVDLSSLPPAASSGTAAPAAPTAITAPTAPTAMTAQTAMTAALAAAAELRQAHPDWGSAVTRVDVLAEDDFRFHTRSLPFPLLLRRGDLAAKVHSFEALLPELGRRYTALHSVDLRFPRRIVVQPATASEAAASKPFTSGGAG